MDNEKLINEVMSRNPKKILNKTENYALYEAGIFGNKALTWNSYGEILKSDWKGGVCMRSKKGIDRRIQQHYVNRRVEEIPKCIEEWVKNFDVPEEMIAFNQSMPDEYLILQGEVLRDGLFCLLYSRVKKPMNLALKEKSEEVTGDDAEKMLRQNLFEESYRDLTSLLTKFPHSVVEFSTYSIPVGNLVKTGRNTVFWEVRNY